MDKKIKKIGKYLIKGKIAEGGMGTIFRAKHPTLRNDVILKKLTLSGNSSIVDRFKREAQLMLEFSNDNIVQVYDHFREGNSYYIVMEYVDGISLDALIEKNRFLPNEIALLIYRETCKALHYAHMKGVIHRDIKPDNVLISKTGEVKLTDFGIARSENCDEECLTSAGMTLGTPTYMSPEQIDDSSKVDKRSDIYSMGVMLYVMVTGKSPFPSNLVPQTINAIQKGKYVKPEKLNPKIISVIRHIIKKSMHCKIKRRFDSVEHVVRISDRRLKKFKTDGQINTAIMEYAYNKKLGNSKSMKRNILYGIVKGFVAALAGTLIAAGILFYLYLNGFHYEYLYPKTFGAVKIVFNTRKSHKEPQKQYKDIKIFEIVNGKYRENKSIKYKFKTVEEKKYFLLQTDKFYLRSGRYRIKAYFENQLFQKDFFLYPRVMQKQKNKTLDGVVIEIFNKEIPHIPVKMAYSIKDNDLDITKKSKLFIKRKRKWIPWEDFIKSDKPFVSGKSYSFKAVCVDYYPVYARVYIEPSRTFLNLQLELNPIPGYIYLISTNQEFKFSINNSEYYFKERSGGEARKYTIASKKFIKYTFAPGTYNIKVELDKNTKKSVELIVTSGSRTKIKIEVNQAMKTINFLKKAGGRYVNIN